MSKTYPPNNSDVCPCTCGALPHGVGVRTDGTVGLTKYRKSSRYAADGGWSVVCTRCGRVGERGSGCRSTQRPDGTRTASAMAR